MACRIPLMEPIDINTINFENNLLGVEYKYDDDDSLTLAFQNTNVESVID
jgi:hypothetical protein